MFNPMQAQVGDQVLVEIKSFSGIQEITGVIWKWANCGDYIDVRLYIDLDEPVAIWNEKDIRTSFCLRVGPNNEERGLKRFRILA